MINLGAHDSAYGKSNLRLFSFGSRVSCMPDATHSEVITVHDFRFTLKPLLHVEAFS